VANLSLWSVSVKHYAYYEHFKLLNGSLHNVSSFEEGRCCSDD